MKVTVLHPYRDVPHQPPLWQRKILDRIARREAERRGTTFFRVQSILYDAVKYGVTALYNYQEFLPLYNEFQRAVTEVPGKGLKRTRPGGRPYPTPGTSGHRNRRLSLPPGVEPTRLDFAPANVSQTNNMTGNYANPDVTNEQASGAIPRTASKTVAHKTAHFRKTRAKRPSHEFKAKVLKSLKGEEAIGVKQDISYMYFLSTALNKQTSYIAPNNDFAQVATYNGITTTDFWMFHPQYFLDAASVLFNKKTATQGIYDLGNPYNIGDSNGAGVPTPPPNPQLARFTVIDSYETWHLKNNTQRAMKLKYYLCQPRSPGFSSSKSWNIYNGYVVGNTPNPLVGPAAQWNATTADDLLQGVTNCYITELHTEPTHNAAWNKFFKADLQILEIPPGGTHTLMVPGPKMLEVDFTKYIFDGNIQDIRTYCRAPLFILQTDLTGAKGDNFPGRDPYIVADGSNVPAGDGTFVGFERVKKCKIAFPQQVGAIEVNTSTTIPMLRATLRDRYISNTWIDVGTRGSAIDVNPNYVNPNQTSL